MNSNLSLTDDLWQSTLRLFSGSHFPSSVPGFPVRAHAAARARSRLAAVPRQHVRRYMPTQLPRVPSLIPSSFATRAIGRDVSITIFTASSLNSGEKLFFGRGNSFTFPNIHPNGWTVRKPRGTSDGMLVIGAFVYGWLYADRRRRLWYGRGVVCTGHRGGWRTWLPGCADAFL